MSPSSFVSSYPVTSLLFRPFVACGPIDTRDAAVPAKFGVATFQRLGFPTLRAPYLIVSVRRSRLTTVFLRGQDDTSIYVDANTRIQILETMMDLPTADKEQSAAFIVSDFSPRVF